MKRIIGSSLLIFGLMAPSYAQTIPPTQPMNIDRYIKDALKTSITWNWNKGTLPDATGFNIYCGDVTNTDGTYSYYTEYANVPDMNARSYLIGPVIMEVLNHYGVKAVTPTVVYDALAHIHCLVVAYNAAGESTDTVAGIPSNPSNVRLVEGQ